MSLYSQIESTLIERVASEVCPCDDCPNKQKCTEEEMTCQSYWLYLQFGNANYLDREPSHKRYKNIFERVA